PKYVVWSLTSSNPETTLIVPSHTHTHTHTHTNTHTHHTRHPQHTNTHTHTPTHTHTHTSTHTHRHTDTHTHLYVLSILLQPGQLSCCLGSQKSQINNGVSHNARQRQIHLEEAFVGLGI